MKALELKIYPPLSPAVQEAVGWNIEHEWQAYTGFGVEANVPGITAMYTKRLTDAELAAEKWLGDIRDKGGRWAEVLEAKNVEQVQVFHRFASTPHYFEEAA